MLDFLSNIFYISIIALIVFAIWLLIALIRKKQKKIPVIGLIASLVIGISSFAGLVHMVNSADDAASSETASSSSTAKTYKLGQEFKDGDLYGIMIDSVGQNWNAHGQTIVDGDIQSLSVSSTKGLQITFDYTNYDLSENFLPSEWDFTVYDDKGHAGKLVSQQDGQDEVSKGHSGTSTFWVNMNRPVSQIKYVEIEYNNKDTGTTSRFKVNLKSAEVSNNTQQTTASSDNGSN